MEQNLLESDECAWQEYRKNTYMDGTIGANGEKFYESFQSSGEIQFVFAQRNVVVIGTNQKHVLKVGRKFSEETNFLFVFLDG